MKKSDTEAINTVNKWTDYDNVHAKTHRAAQIILVQLFKNSLSGRVIKEISCFVHFSLYYGSFPHQNINLQLDATSPSKSPSQWA